MAGVTRVLGLASLLLQFVTPICYAKAPKAHKNVLGLASLLQHSTQTPCFGGCLFITPICYTQAPQHKDELNNSKSSRIGDPKL